MTRESVPAPIQVAHLIHTMAYGGVETALLNWIKSMDASRFQVSVICFANPGNTELPFVEAAAAMGIEVETIPWNRKKPVIRSVRKLSALLKARKVSLLHCHNTYADIVGLLAGKLTGVKTLTTLYVWGKFGFVRNTLQGIDRQLLRFFDKVTVHCEETLRGTVERGYPERKLTLLPCGYEGEAVNMTSQERRDRRLELGATEDNFVLIHVARFWPEKAHDVLLEGFKRIVEVRPEARLWLLGVGPIMDQVRILARDLKLENSVTFLGFRTDLAETLALADLQVHPSDLEGVPLAICAGMTAGLPIVATRIGGLAEVIRDGSTGILIEKRQPKQLADAVVSLMNDPGKRKALGQAAAHFINQEYSLEAATRRVERVYEELIYG
jgi:glycosyltransferase involved in cell wall biosynthesis